MRGQALVEFALVTPLLLLIMLGGVQVGLGVIHLMRLEHAVMEGVIAGASEEQPSQRCDVAELVTIKVLRHVPTSMQCSLTNPGNLLTIEAHDDLTLIVPLFTDIWTISATESAVVR
jgi:Flp pilus assembly protein TadG